MIRLTSGPDDRRLVVEPAVATPYDGGGGRVGRGRASAPLPLPRLPSSTVTWCAAVAARFRDDHGACLAIVLVLDRLSRRWSPLIPTQVASGRAVRLALAASDLAHLPAHVLLAGSYQTRGAGDVFDAAAAVPAFGGVHVVEQGRGGRRPDASLLFLRIDATADAALADPAVILVDDVDQALREAFGRLRVG
jgi:hypothetical protein